LQVHSGSNFPSDLRHPEIQVQAAFGYRRESYAIGDGSRDAGCCELVGMWRLLGHFTPENCGRFLRKLQHKTGCTKGPGTPFGSVASQSLEFGIRIADPSAQNDRNTGLSDCLAGNEVNISIRRVLVLDGAAHVSDLAPNNESHGDCGNPVGPSGIF
jgi:hypothetical protein